MGSSSPCSVATVSLSLRLFAHTSAEVLCHKGRSDNERPDRKLKGKTWGWGRVEKDSCRGREEIMVKERLGKKAENRQAQL